MVNIIKNIVVRRLHELTLINMVLSLPLAILCLYYGASDRVVWMTLTAGVVIYMLIQWRMLRQCYFDVCQLLVFYLSNLIASVLFAAIQLGIYHLCSNEVYTWLFSITKFARYSEYGLSIFQSSVIFHGIILLMTLLAPVGMGRFFISEQEM